MGTEASPAPQSGVNTVQGTTALEPTVLEGHRVMVGDLVLDLANQTIQGRARRDVRLTRNEFVVLATLIKNTGRIVKTEDLLGAVVVESSFVDPAVVETYVRYLRDRFLVAKSSATIELIASVGYRLLP